MGTLMQLTTVLLSLFAMHKQVSSYALSSHECTSPLDCDPGECCVIGMMRYSTAQCMPVGQVDNYCREDNPPESRILYYPGGVTVNVTDVYTHVCPCGEGLVCEDNFCALQEDSSYESNYLY